MLGLSLIFCSVDGKAGLRYNLYWVRFLREYHIKCTKNQGVWNSIQFGKKQAEYYHYIFKE